MPCFRKQGTVWSNLIVPQRFVTIKIYHKLLKMSIAKPVFFNGQLTTHLPMGILNITYLICIVKIKKWPYCLILLGPQKENPFRQNSHSSKMNTYKKISPSDFCQREVLFCPAIAGQYKYTL